MLKNLFYNSFEFVISQAKRLADGESLEVNIENSIEEGEPLVSFLIVQGSLKEEAVREQFENFKSVVENRDVQVSLSFDKEILLKLRFVGGTER